MHLLIVKKGALGDVVRTSYFARALKERWGAQLRLSWLTAPSSTDLLRMNPHVDDLWLEFASAKPHRFDRIYSLDDEIDTLEGVATLTTGATSGAFLENGRPTYTQDTAGWFDMGLLSRFGKQRGDELKRLNQRSHAQIFSDIFQVERVTPEFHIDDACRRWAHATLPAAARRVGINPYSGGRWPSKELRPHELRRLIDRILGASSPFGPDSTIVLLGAAGDFTKNKNLAAERREPRLFVACTDESVQHLAAAVGALDYLITSDSLALHLGVAQGVPLTAFFSPTSAAEIDDWGIVTKVISTASDYCSYRKDADNSTISAERIIEAIEQNPHATGHGTRRRA